jgi:hypothetical protein
MGLSGFCLRWFICALIVIYWKVLVVVLVPKLFLFHFGVVLFLLFRFLGRFNVGNRFCGISGF